MQEKITEHIRSLGLSTKTAVEDFLLEHFDVNATDAELQTFSTFAFCLIELICHEIEKLNQIEGE